MRNLLEKVNETVLELWTGILIWGAACQLIPIWFIKDKGGYSLGLWIGVILASAAAFHMWWSLDRGLDREGAAQGFIRKHAFIRYAVIVAVFAAPPIRWPLSWELWDLRRRLICSPLSISGGIRIRRGRLMLPCFRPRLI